MQRRAAARSLRHPPGATIGATRAEGTEDQLREATAEDSPSQRCATLRTRCPDHLVGRPRRKGRLLQSPVAELLGDKTSAPDEGAWQPALHPDDRGPSHVRWMAASATARHSRWTGWRSPAWALPVVFAMLLLVDDSGAVALVAARTPDRKDGESIGESRARLGAALDASVTGTFAGTSSPTCSVRHNRPPVRGVVRHRRSRCRRSSRWCIPTIAIG